MSPADPREGEPEGPVIRDKRRIDPDTYEVRESRETAAPAGSEQPAATEQQPAPEQPAGTEQNGEVTELKTALAERTADLQRLQAEYINYKRRVDRDRDLVRAVAVENVFRDLLGVLDDIRSAREHEELTGGFKAVAEEVQRVAGKYGLEAYGSKGDPFDPHIHEALMHVPAQPGGTAEGATGPVCVEILQPGYKIGDRVIRPARVAVADPPDGDAVAEAPVQDQQVQDQQPDA